MTGALARAWEATREAVWLAGYLTANRLWGHGHLPQPEHTRGHRVVYASTIGPSLHYTWGIFAGTTICGLPALRWSTSPVRTLLGVTCWRCQRAAARAGALR